jgi:hypothetical protein
MGRSKKMNCNMTGTGAIEEWTLRKESKRTEIWGGGRFPSTCHPDKKDRIFIEYLDDRGGKQACCVRMRRRSWNISQFRTSCATTHGSKKACCINTIGRHRHQCHRHEQGRAYQHAECSRTKLLQVFQEQ